jgi:mRNA interferase RelE/StbE
LAFKIEFTNEAVLSIKKLSKDTKTDVKAKILWLAENSDIIIHKKLKGKYYDEMYKLRIGDYRIIYSLNKKDKQIFIELVGHRKSIYK